MLSGTMEEHRSWRLLDSVPDNSTRTRLKTETQMTNGTDMDEHDDHVRSEAAKIHYRDGVEPKQSHKISERRLAAASHSRPCGNMVDIPPLIYSGPKLTGKESVKLGTFLNSTQYDRAIAK
jgi:hypothetical protein